MATSDEKRDLFYFTNSYPFGKGLLWKEHELEEARGKFRDIRVYPLFAEANEKAREVPEGVNCEPPIDRAERIFSNFSLSHLKVLLNPRFGFYMKEFFSQGVYSKRTWIIKWLDAVARMEMLLHSPVYQLLKDSTADRPRVLYFFWGVAYAYLIPFLDKSSFAKIAVRFHGYDLFKERNQGYVPFQRQILKGLHSAMAISDMGNEYLQSIDANSKFHIKTLRLGTIHKGLSKPSDDGVLRMFSCSNLIPLKRVHLIAEALVGIGFPVEWTHIGAGELMELLVEKAKQLPANVVVKFTGWVKTDELLDQYVDKRVDLFINTSDTEGLPVSVMEALSCGIPVLATDVGGTKELVDETVGELLPAGLSSSFLREAIIRFRELSADERGGLRAKAFERFKELCDAQRNARATINFLAGN